MKVLNIWEFTTTEGTAKDTTIPLDTRPGIFFKVITGTFETPLFTTAETNIPVLMLHGDRAQVNVAITVENDTVTITQGYRQASHGFLISYVNNDWADLFELKPVVIDTTEIERVKLSTTAGYTDVTTGLSGNNVFIRTTNFTPTTTSNPVQSVITKDGKEYVGTTFSLSAHQISSDPIRYDYASATIPRAMTVYVKP